MFWHNNVKKHIESFCYIGYVRDDGSIRYCEIYNQGSIIDGVGEKLVRRYNSIDYVRGLVELGDRSFIEDDYNTGSVHQLELSADDWLKNIKSEVTYIYLFRNNIWAVSEFDSKTGKFLPFDELSWTIIGRLKDMCVRY